MSALSARARLLRRRAAALRGQGLARLRRASALRPGGMFRVAHGAAEPAGDAGHGRVAEHGRPARRRRGLLAGAETFLLGYVEMLPFVLSAAAALLGLSLRGLLRWRARRPDPFAASNETGTWAWHAPPPRRQGCR